MSESQYTWEIVDCAGLERFLVQPRDIGRYSNRMPFELTVRRDADNHKVAVWVDGFVALNPAGLMWWFCGCVPRRERKQHAWLPQGEIDFRIAGVIDFAAGCHNGFFRPWDGMLPCFNNPRRQL